MDDKASLLGDKGKRICSEINAVTMNPVKLFDPVEATSADLTKVLVIGGTQFMGRHLVQQLLDQEKNVQVCSAYVGIRKV